MKKPKGFSLVELLVVVAIMLIIAAVAIPNFLRSRMAANEASAASTLRVLNTSESTYVAVYHSGFTDDLAKLGPPASGATANVNNADLVDMVLAGGAPGATPPALPGTDNFTKSGYRFTYTPVGAFPSISAYTLAAAPVGPNSTGTRYFFTNASGVIRQNGATAATASDSPNLVCNLYRLWHPHKPFDIGDVHRARSLLMRSVYQCGHK